MAIQDTDETQPVNALMSFDRAKTLAHEHLQKKGIWEPSEYEIEIEAKRLMEKDRE